MPEPGWRQWHLQLGGQCQVDRSTKWGNPWAIGEWGPLIRKAPDAEGAVGLFSQMMADPEMRAAAAYPADLSPLIGKNLACWCKLGDPCHADFLIEALGRKGQL